MPEPRKRWYLQRGNKVVVYRLAPIVLIAGFSVSAPSIPTLAAISVMSCDLSYRGGPLLSADMTQCDLRLAERNTAWAIAASTTVSNASSFINLLVVRWTVRKLGLQVSLAFYCLWPAARSTVQLIGMRIDVRTGLVAMIASQTTFVLASWVGLMLLTERYVELLEDEDLTTASLGYIRGVGVAGAAIAHLVGGMVSDRAGMGATYVMGGLGCFLAACMVMGMLPWVETAAPAAPDPKTPTRWRFAGELKAFRPRRVITAKNQSRLYFGPTRLGVGVFLGAMAMGFTPEALVLVGQSAFSFTSSASGSLRTLYAASTAIFLTFAFPQIIQAGRAKFARYRRRRATDKVDEVSESWTSDGVVVEAKNRPRTEKALRASHFDLVFLLSSAFGECVLTAGVALVSQRYQLFLFAVVFPVVAGSAVAARGVILEMVSSDEGFTALTAISLAERLGFVLDTVVTPLALGFFALHGGAAQGFLVNAVISICAFATLLAVRYPPRPFDSEPKHEEAAQPVASGSPEERRTMQ